MPDPNHRLARLSLLLVTGASLMACGSLDSASNRAVSVVTPYKMDIVQGNVVTKEQAERVKPGMSRLQVRDILGTPMLTDPFHADRWDYIFTIRRQGAEPQRRSVVAHFKGDTLEKLETPELPTEQTFIASVSRPVKVRRDHVIVLSDAQVQALPKPPAPAPEASVPMGAVRSYPPLEP